MPIKNVLLRFLKQPRDLRITFIVPANVVELIQRQTHVDRKDVPDRLMREISTIIKRYK
jgi:hypothetical protein